MMVLRQDVKEIRDLIMTLLVKDKSRPKKEGSEKINLEKILPEMHEDQL